MTAERVDLTASLAVRAPPVHRRAGSRGSDAVVDVAGAAMGGAQRYLVELDRWLARYGPPVEVIGRHRRLEPRWLASREVHALVARARHVVAANNVSFSLGGAERTVLLRNVLHFLSPDEHSRLAPLLHRGHDQEAALIRAALRRAHRVVVPTSSMAERVAAACPWAEGRLKVLPHPVTPVPKAPRQRPSTGPVAVLCPILSAPYKDLGGALGELRRAISLDPALTGIELRVTCDAFEMDRFGLVPGEGIEALGRLTTQDVATELAAADVIFFPMELESFGYALAEARVNRIPVVSPDTAHAEEVAGDALVGFTPGDPGSLAEALRTALDLELPPLASNPFDADRYFRALFRVDSLE